MSVKTKMSELGIESWRRCSFTNSTPEIEKDRKNLLKTTSIIKNTIRIIIICCLVIVQAAQAIWHEQAKLLASDGTTTDEFGWAVSISGDYAIVGATGYNEVFNGSAYIFKRADDYNDPNWYEQVKLTASDGAAYDSFGECVSISGTFAIVGAPDDDDNGNVSGSAYIFKQADDYNDPNWYEQVKLTASDGAVYDHFGRAVSINGNYAIVGAPYDDDNGSAYIYKRDETGWTQCDKLTASDAFTMDNFGCSVSISGNYAIVGAETNDDDGLNSGSAYIFYFNGIDWIEQAKLTSSDAAQGDYFGCSVSNSGDYAIVGALYDDDNGSASGSAYIFKHNNGSWTEHTKLTASDGSDTDYFGASVSMSGDRVLVAAEGDDEAGTNSGSAYIFGLDNGSWTEHTKLMASDGSAWKYFGTSVSISDDHAIIGVQVATDGPPPTATGWAYIFKEVCSRGDLSGNCFVNFIDFSILGQAWRSQFGDSNWNPVCDISDPNDDVINELDLAVFCGYWLDGANP